MKKSQLYTRTGDSGMTSLVGGIRVKKNSVRLEAYGTIDELNSVIGLLISEWNQSVCADSEVTQSLHLIQNKLFDVGTYLATDNSKNQAKTCIGITPEDIARIEALIDDVDGSLPPLKTFILPGGTRAASVAHLARTVARRAERRILAMLDEDIAVDSCVVKYINRLSDLLFAVSRLANYRLGVPDVPWQK